MIEGGHESDFERRKRFLLEKICEDDGQDIYGERALACLALNQNIPCANAALAEVAEWFERPHPNNRDHQGECDFAAMKLCGAYYYFADTGLLTSDTLEAIKHFFLTHNFQSIYPSENHHLLFRTSRFLMTQALEKERFSAYARGGSRIAREDGEWLKQFIRYRARYGWGEFNSTCYIRPQWECLANLYEHSPDRDLRQLAGMMMDVLLADMAVDSLNGMCGGAHGRIYREHAMDYAADHYYPLQYFYFGTGDLQALQAERTLVDALLCGYRPHSAVGALTAQRTEVYENKERFHLHNVTDVLPVQPLDGSIRKYTYWTPDYVLGSVQKQDQYPCDDSAFYGHHEQHEWDLTFGTSTKARIFSHHPGNSGNEHGYWTGDLRCGHSGHGHCGQFFQHRTALIAMYHIDPGEPYQFIHGYIPKRYFDEVVEEEDTIFIKEGSAYAAIRFLNGYHWAVDGEWANMEVFSNGSRNGIICEAGRSCDFSSFEQFCAMFLGNESHFDREHMTLSYTSGQSGTLFIDTRGTRRLNGQDVNLDYMLFDSPLMRSTWGSGIVDIQAGGYHAHMDFN